MTTSISARAMPTRAAAVAIAALAVLIVASPRGRAADYPTKPIKLVLAFAPGGQADILGRTIGRKLTDLLGQAIVIENRPGAGGSIAAEAVLREAPDGYTLLMVDQGMLAANISLYKRLSYNPQKDFAPITLIGAQANVLVVHPSVPAKSMAEFIALAKARPGTLNFASGGRGSASHMAGELFKREAQIEIVHVPYKGTGPALQDVVAGHVHLNFSAVSPVLEHIRSGALRPLAVSTATRTAILPDIATIAELGLPGYALGTWNGIAARNGTSGDIIATLHRETVKALGDPTVRKPLTDIGVDIVGNTPAEFDAFIKAEQVKWTAIVKASGAQMD